MRVQAVGYFALLFATLAVAQKQAPLPKDLPPYGPEKPLAAPIVSASKLDNGLTVWLVQAPGIPQIAFDLAVRGGYAADPADRPGISKLLASTVTQGTHTKSAKEIAQEIQAAGGDLAASPHSDSIEVGTTVLSAKAEAGIAVLADVAQNAAFADEEVALAKRNGAADLEQQEAEASFLASKALAKELFGEHPYHVIAPTQDSIKASTAAELRQVYGQRFRPDQALLVAVGDFETDKMLEMIRGHFGGWKAPAGPPIAVLPASPHETKQEVTLVPRPGSVQTTLELGAFGPLRGNADYEAAQVANAIYGGEFGSRLVLNIREDKGYTYSPYSYERTLQAAGYYVTRADVRNEVTGPSLNEIFYELNRMVTTSPSEEELTTARRYLVGNEAIQLQARSSVADELANIWIDGLPPDEIGTYGRKIAQTTAADVNAAARKYFPAAKTTIVAVGEEKVVREALEPFGIPMRAAQ